MKSRIYIYMYAQIDYDSSNPRDDLHANRWWRHTYIYYIYIYTYKYIHIYTGDEGILYIYIYIYRWWRHSFTAEATPTPAEKLNCFEKFRQRLSGMASKEVNWGGVGDGRQSKRLTGMEWVTAARAWHQWNAKLEWDVKEHSYFLQLIWRQFENRFTVLYVRFEWKGYKRSFVMNVNV